MKINNLTEYYKSKFINKYNNKYDYSKVFVNKSNEKIIVMCKLHGEFLVSPNNHLNKGSGCPNCKNVDVNFIDICKEIHHNYYDYSLVNYENNRTKIEIICPAHGIFKQLPMNHKNGSICPRCSNEHRKYDLDDLINLGKETHSNKYNYQYVKEDYIRSDKKVRIICPTHGVFLQDPFSHFIRKYGCKLCKPISSGENIIEKYLIENKIEYIRQKTFDKCINLSKLSFDFYIPNLNLCIEYNGKQHYHPISVFGGEEQFKKQQVNDSIKSNYCHKNNINLLIIKYDEDIIKCLSNLKSTKNIQYN